MIRNAETTVNAVGNRAKDTKYKTKGQWSLPGTMIKGKCSMPFAMKTYET